MALPPRPATFPHTTLLLLPAFKLRYTLLHLLTKHFWGQFPSLSAPLAWIPTSGCSHQNWVPLTHLPKIQPVPGERTQVLQSLCLQPLCNWTSSSSQNRTNPTLQSPVASRLWEVGATNRWPGLVLSGHFGRMSAIMSSPAKWQGGLAPPVGFV